MKKPLRKAYDRLFRTKDGKIVIAQFPNWPIWLMGLFVVASMLHGSRHYHQWTVGLAAASLLLWGLLELFDGVNLFRRLLGIAGILFALTVLLGWSH